MKIYLIYDKLAKIHGPVFQQSNDASCARSLSKNPEIHISIDDLVIYSIGYYEQYGEEECFIPHETVKESMRDFLSRNGVSDVEEKVHSKD